MSDCRSNYCTPVYENPNLATHIVCFEWCGFVSIVVQNLPWQVLQHLVQQLLQYLQCSSSPVGASEVPRSGRAQRKNRTFVFFIFVHFLAKCTKYGQTNCQKVICHDKKSLRSRIVGQSWVKKKQNLRKSTNLS